MPALYLLDRSLEAETRTKDGEAEFLFSKRLVDIDRVDGLHSGHTRHCLKIEQVEIQRYPGQAVFITLVVVNGYDIARHPGFIDIERFGGDAKIGIAAVRFQAAIKFGNAAGQHDVRDQFALKS